MPIGLKRCFADEGDAVRTYPRVDERSNQTVGFEIDNAYVSLRSVKTVLSSVQDVVDVRSRRLFGKWEEIHIWFRYRGFECVVWEPHGDSSRYWIGQRDAPEPVDMSDVEQAFKTYQPPLHRRVIGDILTLRFLKGAT
jgi:hypothetical protein